MNGSVWAGRLFANNGVHGGVVTASGYRVFMYRGRNCLSSSKYEIKAGGTSGKEQGVLTSRLAIAGQLVGPAAALWALGGAVAAATSDTGMLIQALDRSALSVVPVATGW